MSGFILESIGIFEILWFIFGLFFLVSIGVAIFIVKVMKRNLKDRSNLKKCLFCAEMIQTEAIVCRFCKKDLPE